MDSEQVKILGMMVELNENCDCGSRYIHRDVALYDQNLYYICNMGDHAKSGIAERCCEDYFCESNKYDCETWSYLGCKLSIEVGKIYYPYKAVKYSFINDSCRLCSRPVRVTFIFKSEFFSFYKRQDIRSSDFPDIPSVDVRCYNCMESDIKPAKC